MISFQMALSNTTYSDLTVVKKLRLILVPHLAFPILQVSRLDQHSNPGMSQGIWFMFLKCLATGLSITSHLAHRHKSHLVMLPIRLGILQITRLTFIEYAKCRILLSYTQITRCLNLQLKESLEQLVAQFNMCLLNMNQ